MGAKVVRVRESFEAVLHRSTGESHQIREQGGRRSRIPVEGDEDPSICSIDHVVLPAFSEYLTDFSSITINCAPTD
jgi:hypothetical protein